MSRMQVRAESQSHDQDQGKGMMEALQDILKGRKPVPGRPHHNRRGRVGRLGQVFDMRGNDDPYLLDPHEGLRPVAGGQGLQGAGAGQIVAEV